MDMPLRTVKTNIVQSIRAFRVQDLQQSAQVLGHHFLYANLAQTQSKQDILDLIAKEFTFPVQASKNFDALYDGMTDPLYKSGPQPGFVVVLEHIPAHAKFDKEAREQLLDIFREAADYWSDRKVAFRCFYSFAVARANESSAWERVGEVAPAPEKPVPKAPPKNGANPNFGMNMPMMSSAFDTAMWLTAA